MNDKDTFAAWIAEAMLRAHGEDFAAEALTHLAGQAQTSADLDSALSAAASSDGRPGDFGVEFIGPILAGLLIEFGRRLWDAYATPLAEQGGKALATATIDKIKELARHTWSRSPSAISLTDAEARLREAATRAGLDAAETEKLVSSMYSPEMAHGLAAK